MADKRIDYEKMALDLISDAFSSAPLHCRIADALQHARAAAAEAQREACEKNIGKAVYATVPSVMWHAKRACAEAVRATPLITESESPDAK